ncbi:MAG: hypothetical protein CL672_08745 [Balneola sp.]|nr:hypothetical protein [Balneola sp.]|tara:strand:+ start:3894 stop:4421 length:528 start_codon:yes stop_codon:yes gene_type:complete
MKSLFSPIILVIVLGLSLDTQAQLRKNLPTPYDYSGPIINRTNPTIQQSLSQFFQKINVQMSQSYEMSFASYGGGVQNINAYTNTLQFAFSPKLQGRVDVSFLHSPFGGNTPGFGSNTSEIQRGFNPRVMIRNAELNYKISDRAFLRVQYQQLPNSMGYNAYSRFNPYRSYGMWY